MEREKVVLVVDDQYGREDDPMIPELYGKMQGYKFILEDAFDKKWGYTFIKVRERIEKEERIDIILLDMRFDDIERYGLEILERIKLHFPELTVLMLSSETDENVIKQCEELGAKRWVVKLPHPDKMKKILDQY